MRNKLNILILTLLIGTVSTAQVQEYSLDEAIKYALENNVNVKNAELEKKIAKKKVWETTAIGLPQVSATGSYQHVFEVPVMESFIPGGDPMALGLENTVSYEAMVTQLVFSGEYLVGLQAARAYKELSGRGATKTQADVKESVSSAYYTILFVEANKAVLDSSLANAQKLLSETEALYKTGFVEETDVDQLKLISTNLENSIATVESQIPIAYDFLKSQLGLTDSVEIKATETLQTLADKSSSLEPLSKEFSLENNIDYQLLNTQERLTLLSLRREQSTVLPSLSAYYRHKGFTEEPDMNFEPKDVVGLSLSVPIFGSGIRMSRIQQANLELEKIQNTKELAAQNITTASDQAKSDYKNSLNIYTNEKSNLELSQRIYTRTLKKYKEGLSSSFDLVQAQNQHLSTQSNYNRAIFNLLNSKTQLNKILNN